MVVRRATVMMRQVAISDCREARDPKLRQVIPTLASLEHARRGCADLAETGRLRAFAPVAQWIERPPPKR